MILKASMPKTYLYAVTYDLGFAPNPFGEVCSLACCKPRIRAKAKEGDWIIGLTGRRLEPPRRCVYAMKVSEHLSFDEYWRDPRFLTRQPKRNGSPKKQVGDNIYHHAEPDGEWIQANSAHSLPDGTQCAKNTAHDTRIDRLLVSDHFIYFGSCAPVVPEQILDDLGYSKIRDYRVFPQNRTGALIEWIEGRLKKDPNCILGDPFDFGSTNKRFSAARNRLV